MSAYVGFHTCSSLQGQILKQQGTGPNGSSILAKLTYHQDQNKSVLQDVSLTASPASWSLVSPFPGYGELDPPFLLLGYLGFLAQL